MHGLTMTQSQWEILCKHLGACLPEEGCGLLGGEGETVLAVLPVENALHSPVRFRMNPEEQLRAFTRIEQEGMDLVGIFHSHPKGPRHPSGLDVAEFAYPGVVNVICFRNGAGWEAKGFWMGGGKYDEVPVRVTAHNA